MISKNTNENNKRIVDEEESGKIKPYLLQVSQKAVIYNPEDRTFLLVKDVDENNFFSTHYGPWELPGGRFKEGETLSQGLDRELKEELGDIEYEPVSDLGAADIAYRSGRAVALGYLMLYKGGEVTLSQEHSKYKWETIKTIRESNDYKPWLKLFVEKAEKCIAEKGYLDGWRRCQADFENYKKRQAESQKDLIAYANQNLILEILPVVDNFHASTEHVPEGQKDQPWVTGIMHIQRQLENILKDMGVTEIGTASGDKFDPNIHEAVENKECPPEKCKNMIKNVILRGYKIGEKVIRPARVIVE